MVAYTPLLLIIASVVAVLHATGLTCPPGQTKMGSRCYKTYRPSPTCDKDFSFSNASKFCQDNGGQLASIHNQTEADFFENLIKSDQKAKQKACNAQCKEKQSCDCANANQDYFYWIGMQLTHSANGSVSGASWTDGTAVNYGNPTSASFRPPFVTGRPIGSADDGHDDSEVCPGGNPNKCVQVYGYGPAMGRWRDQNCNTTHVIEHNCACNSTTNSTSSNSHHHRHKHHSSSSSSSAEEEVHVDECRDEAALNGFICQYCPEGFTMFQGHCYKAIMVGQNANTAHATCAAQGEGVKVVSIHSAAENQFVAELAQSGNNAAGAYFIGILLVHPNNLLFAPVTSASWSDGSPADYGNPSVAPWNTFGTYPWAPAIAPGIVYPNQPDNRPPPGDCVLAWLPPSGHPIGTWDDITCSQIGTDGVVCKV